ncbi:hypothetical protein C6A37_01500 [Desulfobacteraceae bacterium SEEP-SAG9]|nr:hypothetical protein C6A37_01500 [Desulfobacteraceae bacterium SEEP-SAG9]
MSINFWKFCLRFVGPLIFFLVLYFYVDFRALKDVFLLLQWRYFGFSLVLVPLLVLVRSMRWKIILARYGIEYSTWRCFRIYFTEMVAVMAVSTIGTFAKVVYLKRDGYGLFQPTLSVIIDKYYDYLLPLIFGVTSAVSVWAAFSPDVSLLVLLGVTCIAFIPARNTINYLFPRVIPKRLKNLLSKQGWDATKHLMEIHQALGYKTYALAVTGFGIYFLCVYFLNRGMGIDLSFSQVVLVMTITTLITLIPISFFGVGTRDVGLLAVFPWFGRTPEEAVALSLALLLLRVAIVLIGSIFWFADPPPFIGEKEIINS